MYHNSLAILLSRIETCFTYYHSHRGTYHCLVDATPYALVHSRRSTLSIGLSFCLLYISGLAGSNYCNFGRTHLCFLSHTCAIHNHNKVLKHFSMAHRQLAEDYKVKLKQANDRIFELESVVADLQSHIEQSEDQSASSTNHRAARPSPEPHRRTRQCPHRLQEPTRASGPQRKRIKHSTRPRDSPTPPPRTPAQPHQTRRLECSTRTHHQRQLWRSRSRAHELTSSARQRQER